MTIYFISSRMVTFLSFLLDFPLNLLPQSWVTSQCIPPSVLVSRNTMAWLWWMVLRSQVMEGNERVHTDRHTHTIKQTLELTMTQLL